MRRNVGCAWKDAGDDEAEDACPDQALEITVVYASGPQRHCLHQL
jgi:hypothetical protein